jgi:chromatin remodeling complex protein RSC6
MSTKASTKKTTASKKTATVSKKVKKVETVQQPTESSERKERKRRDVTKETIDNDFGALQQRIEMEITRLKDPSQKARGVKFLRSINKALKTLHSDTKRVMKLKKKNNRKKTVVSGFLKPIKISDELATFTGWDVNGTYSRVNVTKFICKYIKDNGLFNPDDMRLILCDEKLKNLLNYDPQNPGVDSEGNPTPLNYFRLQRYLKPHFIKIEGQETATPAPVVEAKAEKSAPKSAPKSAAKVPATSTKAARKTKKAAAEDEDDA